MKKLQLSLIIAAAAISALPLNAQERANSTGGNSPHETTSAVIGDRRTGCRITITYGRPYMKGRKIWGTTEDKALVPNGRAWRLGSDEATLLVTQQPLAFGDTTIPAGAYTLYLVPNETGASKLAFSSKLGGWGVPVVETSDVARVDLKKEAAPKPVEQLTIAIERDSAGTGGTIKIAWGDGQFSAPFTVKK
jgi:hypothetical protein